MTTTGICVAASEPAGTSMVPVAFRPRSAVAVPTVKEDCCAAAESGGKLKKMARARGSGRGMEPPANENTPGAALEQIFSRLWPRLGVKTSRARNNFDFALVYT